MENKDPGDINIAHLTNPSKVMEIEYFCKDSHIDTIDRYDVFPSEHTSDYMDIAFNIANARYSLITYDTDLTPRLTKCDPYDPGEIA